MANRESASTYGEAQILAAARSKMGTRARSLESLAAAIRSLLKSGADPAALGQVYESLLAEVRSETSGSARKAHGVYFTPPWLVELVLDFALDPVMDGLSESALLELRVLDPACGCGAFLTAAARRMARRMAATRGDSSDAGLRRAMRDVCERCIHGMDTDPVSVDICRATLSGACGGVAQIVEMDGLLGECKGSFDVVVGNPPFLNRLERSTMVNLETSALLKRRFGAAARAYTDASWLFLLRGVQLARPGGRVSMVLPQSILGARDAEGVRAAVAGAARMTDLWLAQGHAFDASVYVCVPTFEVGTHAEDPRVRRWLGTAATRAADAGALDAGSWARLAALDVPQVTCVTEGVLGEIAEISADFRDEYYGLVGCVTEDEGQPEADFPRLLTTGLIELGRCEWGLRPCRFGGASWKAPRVDVSLLSTPLKRWAAAKRKPKVLLATQTKVLEAAVDEQGNCLPVTPLISIVPRRPGDVWLIAAILCSPVLSILAASRTAGTGLSRSAIKLSAAQTRDLPLPKDRSANLGERFRSALAVDIKERADAMLSCARHVCNAYGLSDTDADRALRWWRERADL